ncbi:MAG: hypothetical protein LQ349_002588 [Xanthoria aureola]|nr:MAG: hypothetical protein LQ349_002588 [Xanthoria aureola]
MASPPFGATAVATDDVAAPYSAALLQPRAFQYEMLDESLRRNIIVAMDTGSGKTLMYDTIFFPASMSWSFISMTLA